MQNNINVEAIEQITMEHVMDNVIDKEENRVYFEKKIIELMMFNTEQVANDIGYVLNQELYKENNSYVKLLEKYIYIQRCAGHSFYESYYYYWCFLYEFIPKNFYKGMTEALLKQNRTLSINSLNKTKKRWRDTALKSVKDGTNKLLNKEFIQCKKDYLQLKGNIQPQYNVSSPDDLVEYRTDWFSKWLSSDRFLMEYPYLMEFSPKKINHAFEVDLHNCITTIIMGDYNYNIDSIQTKRPEDLMRSGIFGATSRTQMEYTTKEIDGNIQFVSEINNTEANEGLRKAVLSFNPQNIQVTDEDLTNNSFLEFIISSTISPDALQDVNNNPSIKRKLFSNLTFDQYDSKILELILNKVEGPTVRIYGKEFIKYLGLSRSSYNYKMIEGKVMKFPGYFYVGEFVNQGSISMNFISSVLSLKDEYGEPYLDITIGQNLYLSITKGKVMQLYTTELKKLKSLLAQTFAYMFLMERNKFNTMGEDISECDYTYSMDFMKQFVYIDKKTKVKKNMDILEDGVKELCDNKFIIKSYIRGKDFFKVKFFPDTEDKRNIINSTVKFLPEYIKD